MDENKGPEQADKDVDDSAPDFKSLGTFSADDVGLGMRYIMSGVLEMAGPIAKGSRVLDVGCGMGGLAAEFSSRGAEVTGIDLDEPNLATAAKAYPNVRFVKAAADENILTKLGVGGFDLVTCTEVVEHLYSPHSLLAGCFAACRPGGRFVISAPYHGYIKDLVIAAAGKTRGHYNPLWEGGHIKFFDRATMTELLKTTGFVDMKFAGVGRVPYLWKSLIMSGNRPR